MYDLPDSWVWDFWFADDGEKYHLFYLYASRALHDPDLRHFRAGIGHAVSDDLVAWEQVADALVHGDAPAFDELATWTGSTIRGEDGTWYLYYTGIRVEEDGGQRGYVQRIGFATSSDLMTWTKAPQNPVVEADARWYEKLADPTWVDEAWRDPWLFRHDGSWHMLVTGRANHGSSHTRGVVGHAVSADLRTWEVRPPLSEPVEDGFGQLEVMQVEEVDGRPVLIFSCLPGDAAASRRAAFPRGAVWAVPAQSVLGPFRIEDAYPLTDDDLYVGRLIRRRDDGAWQLLAFRNTGADGAFVGGVTDPMPVRWDGDRLVVDRG